MVKKFTKHDIEPERPAEVRPDGKPLTAVPVKPSSRRKKFEEAQEWAHKKYANAFKKLAQ